MRPTKSILILWILVLLVPTICVLAAGSVVSLLRHRTPLLFVEPNTFLAQCVIAGSPFFVLAFISSVWALWKSTTEHWRRTRIAAYWGIVATMLLWGITYVDLFIPRGAGPNIGLGLLMLASPLIVGIVMSLAFVSARSKEDVPA